MAAASPANAPPKHAKVFWFFFSKKNILALLKVTAQAPAQSE
jgi:hypothetical protein